MAENWTTLEKLDWENDVGIVGELNRALAKMNAAEDFDKLLRAYESQRDNVRHLLPPGRRKWEEAYARNVLRVLTPPPAAVPAATAAAGEDDENDDPAITNSAIEFRHGNGGKGARGVYLVAELRELFSMLTAHDLLPVGTAMGALRQIGDLVNEDVSEATALAAWFNFAEDPT